MNENFSPWDFALVEVGFNPHAVYVLTLMRKNATEPPIEVTVSEKEEIAVYFDHGAIYFLGSRCRIEVSADQLEKMNVDE